MECSTLRTHVGIRPAILPRRFVSSKTLFTDSLDLSYLLVSELAASHARSHEILTLCRCLGRIVQTLFPPSAV